MPKKKKPIEVSEASRDSNAPPSPNLPPPTTPTVSSATSKKAPKVKAPTQQPPSASQLIICRNKHWRYISSFHGPWLQLPVEILETVAHTNYNHPRPRPIDPAVFFDLVKIRRLVDDATNTAVKAASGVVSTSGSLHHPGAAALGLGFGSSSHGHKLSPERRHRLRVDATLKLSKAYHLDEIACSVATMQSASTLEDVASLVLQRNSNDPDATYVHFFHEKIPSRQLAESTSLEPLDQVIAQRSAEAEPLRTRATVRVFKEDYEGAATDLTSALNIARFHRNAKAANKHENKTQVAEWKGARSSNTILDEDKQPSSLEIQLLFQRAGVYLTIACQHVNAALPDGRKGSRANGKVANANGSARGETNGSIQNGDGASASQNDDLAGENQVPELNSAEKEAQSKQLAARKMVKTYAKRALRDYLAYLSHFDYSPDLPLDLSEDYSQDVTRNKDRNYSGSTSSTRPPRTPRMNPDYQSAHVPTDPPQRIYTLDKLFDALPPADLPAYPSTDLVVATKSGLHPPPSPTTETITYHPLLTDALHGLLLAHSLIQTSAKELLRHAYMVARLARLADGYPVFQASRSPARADWIDVLRRAGGTDWIKISSTWESLCAPAPLPMPSNSTAPTKTSLHPQNNALPAPEEGSKSAEALKTKRKDAAGDGNWKDTDDLAASTDHLHITSGTPTHPDQHVNPEYEARQRRIEERYNELLKMEKEEVAIREGDRTVRTISNAHQPRQQLEGADSPPATSSGTALAAKPSTETPNALVLADKSGGSEKTPTATSEKPRGKRWAVDDGREYPIVTERAAAVARWIKEAPLTVLAGTSSGARRKKKGKKPGLSTASSAVTATEDGGEDEVEQ